MATLHVRQGDDYAAVVTVEGIESLDGFTAAAQVRRQPADWSPVVADFGIVMGTTTITMALGHDVTEQLHGAYVWDLQLVGPDGDTRTLIGGAVWTIPEVTRAA